MTFAILAITAAIDAAIYIRARIVGKI